MKLYIVEWIEYLEDVCKNNTESLKLITSYKVESASEIFEEFKLETELWEKLTENNHNLFTLYTFSKKINIDKLFN